MQPLTPPDSHHLAAAQGWLELGNHLEADKALDEISPELRVHPDVLEVRWNIYAEEKRWPACVDIGKALLTTPEARAVSLSWLIHLIGDEHQPLHCASFYSDAYPEGDRGGNEFYVRPAQTGVRLHGVWDGLLGSSANPRTQWNYAIELEKAFPKKSLPELLTNTTPKAWSLESRKLAIEQGYLRAELKGSTNAQGALGLPDGYTKSAKSVAERQGALAGYRLAHEIQTHLKYNGIAPPLPVVAAATPKAPLPDKIGAAQARQYYDESMVVTGKVVQVSSRPTITFLNLDQPSPNSPLPLVIFPDNLDKFGDLHRFNNQNVEVTGTITEYHNKPEIILESPDQIKIDAAK